MSWNRPYYDDRDDDRFDLPFADESKWEDEDRAYDEMVDEEVLRDIATLRCAELTRQVQDLERKIAHLTAENNSLRKMLHGTDLIRQRSMDI